MANFLGLDQDSMNQALFMTGLGMLSGGAQGRNPLQALGMAAPHALQLASQSMRQRKMDEQQKAKDELMAKSQMLAQQQAEQQMAYQQQQQQQELMRQNAERNQQAHIQAMMSQGLSPQEQMAKLAQITGDPRYAAQSAQFSQDSAPQPQAPQERQIRNDALGIPRFVDSGQEVFPGSVDPRMLMQAKMKPLSQVNVGAGQTEFQKVTERKAAERYDQIIKAGTKASQSANMLSSLGTALEQFGATGTFGERTLQVSRMAKALGIPVDEKKLGSGEVAQALTNELTLMARSTEGGGGMPGAMSEADREFLKQIPPSISKTPAGNKLLISVLQRKNQRAMEVAKLADEYVQAYGKLDSGFSDLVRKRYENDNMFSQQELGAVAPTQEREWSDL